LAIGVKAYSWKQENSIIMYDNVLLDHTKKNIEIISANNFIKRFYLAGGTSCSLRLGHRISYDLDFFTDEEFDTLRLTRQLKNIGDLTIDYSDSGTLTGKFNNTNISFIRYKYKILKKHSQFLGLKIASLEDVGCMKIEAIVSRGKKRDFIDLYFILNELQSTLQAFFKLYHKKYDRDVHNETHILKSFIYFTDADLDPDLNMLVSNNWEDVKKFFIEQEVILKYSIQNGIQFKS
jgi:predicted nucleotidyltransferase component of viral defense system